MPLYFVEDKAHHILYTKMEEHRHAGRLPPVTSADKKPVDHAVYPFPVWGIGKGCVVEPGSHHDAFCMAERKSGPGRTWLWSWYSISIFL